MTDLPDRIISLLVSHTTTINHLLTMPTKKGSPTGMAKSSTGLHHHGLAKGGQVKRTGKYLLHKGEQVLSPAKVKAMKQIAGFAMSGKAKNVKSTAKKRVSAFVKGKKRKACGCKRK
jgi:hypothetical protein